MERKAKGHRASDAQKEKYAPRAVSGLAVKADPAVLEIKKLLRVVLDDLKNPAVPPSEVIMKGLADAYALGAKCSKGTASSRRQ